MSFDKTKPLHFVADNGKDTGHMMLTKDNDWSLNAVGLWFYWEKMYKLVPWTSIIEMWQFKPDSNSDGKNY